MKIITLLFIVTVISFSCHSHYSKGTFVKLETQYGDVTIELYPKNAPLTVQNFLTYVDSGFYKQSTFYRVLKSENQPTNSFRSDLIQGGIYQSNYKKSVILKGIPHESTRDTKLSHLDGSISLARTLPGTASSEFFICIGNQPAYDYGGNSNPEKQGYAVFGRVVKGMEIIRQIHNLPENGEDYITPVLILNIERVN